MKTQFRFNYRPWVIPAVLFVLWTLASRNAWVDAALLPAPPEVVVKFQEAWQRQEIVENILASLKLNSLGFVIGGLVGVTAGLILAAFHWLDRFFSPTLNALKHVAIFAWIPLMIMWFGHGDVSKVLFVSLAVFYPVFYNTYDGVKQIPKSLLEVANIYQFNAQQRFLKVILPAAAPSIFAGLNIALVFSWLATIGAEYFFVAKQGVVNPLLDGAALFDMAEIFYGMVVVGVVGLLFYSLAQYFENYNLRWRQQQHK